MRFDVNDGEQLAAEIDDLFARSEIFKQYVRDYYSQEEFENHFEMLRATAKRVAGGDEVDDTILERALYLLITAGKIKPRKAAAAPIEETPVDDRPRDKNGKLLSQSQIAWVK